MKNVKITTKLYIGFLAIEALLILSLYFGYTSAAKILQVEDPQGYLSSYAYFTAVLFVAMMVVATSISVWITRTIRKSLAEVAKATNALAIGKVDITLKKTSNDEFGKLIGDLQMVIDNIKEQADVMQRVAEGDMTVDITPKSQDDVMGNAIKKLVAKNNEAMSNIKEAAFQVTTSSSQVASASEALAQGSTEQASAIQQITASIEDIAEKTKVNAEQANDAATLIVKAIEEVNKGNAQMQNMVVAMRDINKSSENISKIIKVIDDIAFQTNILALNAAVEAARAGEAGKGFAVVAEEVRNLAAKSASAASETADMIESSIQKVHTGSDMANVTAGALNEINEAVKRSEKLIKDIATASNYQATAIIQIEQAIEQVSQVVQTNSATSEECAAASQEMADQAGIVRQMVSVFKLD